MPHLQTLSIKFWDRCIGERKPPFGNLNLSGSALTDMHQLETVSLEWIDVDDDFCSQLASKTKLKKLEFGHLEWKLYSNSFFPQINLLGSLEELNLQVAEQNNIVGYSLLKIFLD